jgi:hypothetical protein
VPWLLTNAFRCASRPVWFNPAFAVGPPAHSAQTSPFVPIGHHSAKHVGRWALCRNQEGYVLASLNSAEGRIGSLGKLSSGRVCTICCGKMASGAAACRFAYSRRRCRSPVTRWAGHHSPTTTARRPSAVRPTRRPGRAGTLSGPEAVASSRHPLVWPRGRFVPSRHSQPYRILLTGDGRRPWLVYGRSAG